MNLQKSDVFSVSLSLLFTSIFTLFNTRYVQMGLKQTLQTEASKHRRKISVLGLGSHQRSKCLLLATSVCKSCIGSYNLCLNPL